MDDFHTKILIAKKKSYIDTLSKHICQISFQKVDGSLRVMKCTLIPDKLPPYEEKKQEGSRNLPKNGQSYVSIFDLDIKQWRAFRIENLISIDVIGE